MGSPGPVNSTRQNIAVQNNITIYVCLQALGHRVIRLDYYFSPHAFKFSSEYAKLTPAPTSTIRFNTKVKVPVYIDRHDPHSAYTGASMVLKL
jgi:hypothetical protein